MDWMELLSKIFELCIIPLIGILTSYLITFIRMKKTELVNKTEDEKAQKYLDMIGETVIDCVLTTNQTYVDSLKAQGKFDVEAQKIAFQKTYDMVIKFLSAEAKDYIAEVYGDVTEYLTSKIEAQVNLSK